MLKMTLVVHDAISLISDNPNLHQRDSYLLRGRYQSSTFDNGMGRGGVGWNEVGWGVMGWGKGKTFYVHITIRYYTH